MKKVIINFVLLFAIFVLVVGCEGQFDNANQLVKAAKADIVEISVDDFKNIMGNEEFELIDVRTAGEFAAGHIPDAINIPRGLLEFKITNKYTDINTNIILYCKKGGRSALAAKSLGQLKYKNVRSIAGGWNAWAKAAPAPKKHQTPEEIKQMVKASKKWLTEITPADLKKLMQRKNNLVIVDVREPKEFEAGDISGSVNIPRGLLEFKITKKYPNKSTNIVIYCKSGGRAALAAEALKDIKYKNVKSLAGGWEAWSKFAATPVSEVKAVVGAAKKSITEISVDDYKTMVKDGKDFVLIDVRQAAEYAAGYIPNAINIPRGLLEFKILGIEKDKNKTIVIYCKKGGRAALAAKSLAKRLKYNNVKSIDGGFLGYTSDPKNPVAKPIKEKMTKEPESAPKVSLSSGCGG
ncbi:MAG: rhodanese-like domain-containing protein [candidate division Zixibacteria bacterium]|nr:rhodanese-like domain-containing protein [candidate division Zixibacteria bacterium]